MSTDSCGSHFSLQPSGAVAKLSANRLVEKLNTSTRKLSFIQTKQIIIDILKLLALTYTSNGIEERRNEMFYLMMHKTHFITAIWHCSFRQ